jgi:hypothetical protein
MAQPTPAAPKVIDIPPEPKVGDILAVTFIQPLATGAQGSKQSLSLAHQSPIVGQSLKGLAIAFDTDERGLVVRWLDNNGKPRCVWVPMTNVQQVELLP